MTAQVIDFMAHLRARQSASVVTSTQGAVAMAVRHEEPSVMGLEEDTVRQGSKYDARLDARDIPALIRADIKAAKAARKIHKDVKVSVRFESYSMGCAIRVNVTKVPEGFVVRNPAFAAAWEAHEKAHAVFFDFKKVPRYTNEAQSLLDTLSGLVTAYQKTRENANSDYYNVNFSGGDVHFDLG